MRRYFKIQDRAGCGIDCSNDGTLCEWIHGKEKYYLFFDKKCL